MGEKGQATEVPPNTEVASVGPSSGGLPNVGPRTGAGGSTPRPDKDPA